MYGIGVVAVARVADKGVANIDLLGMIFCDIHIDFIYYNWNSVLSIFIFCGHGKLGLLQWRAWAQGRGGGIKKWSLKLKLKVCVGKQKVCVGKQRRMEFKDEVEIEIQSVWSKAAGQEFKDKI
jgi:hypothetical protein